MSGLAKMHYKDAAGVWTEVTPSTPLPSSQVADTTVTGPAALAAINTDLLTGTVSGWYDASAFRSVSVQINASAGITAGAIIFEQTNDIAVATPPALRAYESSSISQNPFVAAITIAASTSRLFTVAVTARFIRVRISTAFTGGTVQVVASFSQRSAPHPVVNVQQSVAGNLNATATLAAGTALAGDVAHQYRATATGAATPFSLLSTATPAAVAVKASAGRLLGFVLQNSSAAVRSVKFWNVLQAGVTLGTTAALFEIDIPAGGLAVVSYEGGIAFGTAITVAVTGAKGLSDNTGALGANDVSGVIVFA